VGIIRRVGSWVGRPLGRAAGWVAARGRSSIAWLSLPGRLFAVFILALHLGLLGTAIGLATRHDANLSPRKSATPACRAVLDKDDLVHLALRDADQARRQLDRWKACDGTSAPAGRTTRERAKHSLSTDAVLIAVIGAAFLLAVIRCLRRVRWRLAAYIGGALAAIYVAADIRENQFLGSLLQAVPHVRRGWPMLPWLAAIKFGALFGALPIFVVSLCLAFGEVQSPGPPRKAPIRLDAAAGFCKRWWGRIRHPRGSADEITHPLPSPGALGVACSGGGIRSAAFSLGALQKLDKSPGAVEGKSELASARWLSAVSGGSYIAAAWINARRAGHLDAWSRLSVEEDHLRRHSSYIAPGVAGKIWALVRFLLGFGMNLLLVALALLFLFLPYGWAVDSSQHARPLQGGSRLGLAQGGCLELADGRYVVAVAGTTLRLSAGASIPLDPNTRVLKKKPKAVTSTKTETKFETKTETKTPTKSETRELKVAANHETTAEQQEPKDDATVARCIRGRDLVPSASPSAQPAKSTTGLRAKAEGRRLEKHTFVLLRAGAPLRVNGRNVSACEMSSSEREKRCPESQARVYQMPTGTRLLSAPRAVAELARPGMVRDQHVVRACGTHACQSAGPATRLGTGARILAGLTLLVGIAHVVVRPRPATSRWAQILLRSLGTFTFLVLAFVFVVPYLIVLAENGRWWLEDEYRFAVPGAGVATIGGALLSQIGAFTGSNDKAGAGPVSSFVKSLGARLRPLLLRLAGAVVGPLLVVIAAILIGSFAAQHGWQPGQVGLWIGAFGVFACLLAGGDLNEWSLHPFYRDRLRSGFVGDAPITDEIDTPLAELPDGTPELIVCAAANVADSHLTAPGRPVVPWVFGKAGIGSDAIGRAMHTDGVLPPADFTGKLAPLTSLWTAVAVSGAAFSPAMGKMTRPERFLFALGNLRLGVWYPNPSCLKENPEYYKTHHPRPWYLAKEAIGLHRVDDPWIYVTDGGHYENLGLVELLRRGCREIYCFDGSGDSTTTFGTLAEAMRLARAELGVEIDFNPVEALKADEHGISKLGVWAGTVRYRENTSSSSNETTSPWGWLVVAKLEVPKDAPFDIVDLARTLPSFPSTSTGDQLYTDQKFEAYRALGEYLGEEAARLGSVIRGLRARGDSVATAVERANAALLASVK
jgi:hypothetical protein